jgi:hypothetical protein
MATLHKNPFGHHIFKFDPNRKVLNAIESYFKGVQKPQNNEF